MLQLVPAVIAFRLDRESLRPLWAVAQRTPVLPDEEELTVPLRRR